jgi:hypothetical protein
MFTPPHGFCHAATLLLTNSIRSLPHDGSPALVAEVLGRLARDLVALAEDTRAPAEAVEWTMEEYRKMLNRASQTFSHRGDADFAHLFDMAQTRGAEILEAIGKHTVREREARDLFLMYVPEDRLPVAAPIAIELTKRRFSVAFSEYEVATSDQMCEGIQYGLSRHRAGVLLATREVACKGWTLPMETDRFRVLRPAMPVATANDLAVWLATLIRQRSPGV